ncbi:MAG: phosphoadenosine phosphosulfate reductase family protein [Candidatus Omnitrophica bacterium]|nr:phosphoadenosine phosphosulfate reductase family protein [Candidatus Omnitrophota bacterium]
MECEKLTIEVKNVILRIMSKFDASKFIKEKINEIKSVAKEDRVLVLVSEGVDSVVCALLAYNAIKENAIFLYVNTGLVKSDKSDVLNKFLQKYNIELQVWDMNEKFFQALKEKTVTEEKIEIYKDIFYRTISQATKSYSVEYVIQGTILPDIIEFQKGVKTFYNVFQDDINPQIYGLKIIEPLKELYKNQVYSIAKLLKIPPKIVHVFPFPFTGFTTRIGGEITAERIEKIRLLSSIVEEEFKSPKIYQAFPVLLGEKAAGIINEKKITGDVVVVRAVETKNIISARPYNPTCSKMEKIQKRIIREVPGVVKVLFDITPKPPSDIEFF